MQWGMVRNTQDARVLITPVTAKKIVDLGHIIHIEKQSGEASGFSDDAYQDVGAKLHKKIPHEDIDAWVVATPPTEDFLKNIKAGSYVVGMLKPHTNKDAIKTWAATKARFLSLELIPRITRAQSMDVLSSQSNLAGYRAVVVAAARFGKCLPLMMTAAGTIPAARVLVIGAGVAGLQAIATAKRLGAVVHAFDVRAAAKEQVESLGAQFVEVPSDESGDGQGGYAKEMSAAYQAAQAAKLAEVLATSDIVITTALIPGKQAPILVTEAMVNGMKPGSIIVDLASESGGNCEVTKHGQESLHKGVIIMAPTQILADVAHDASQLLARNTLQFMQTVIDASGELKMEDEITTATLLTDKGRVVHPLFATASGKGKSNG